MSATGLIVTTSVKDLASPQSAVLGTTVYVAVWAVTDVWLNNPEIMVAPEPVFPPLKPGVNDGKSHRYKVLAGTIPLVILTGDTEKEIPVHTALLIVLIFGVG